MTRISLTGFSCVALLLAACTPNDDPAAGGFISGVAGVAGGGYQERVDTRQATADSEAARSAALRAELAGLQGELRQARLQLSQARSRLAAEGKAVPAQLDAEVNVALTQEPSGVSDEERVAKLREAVLRARKLSSDLAMLS